MARPKKPRIVDGVQLADNLYPDARKRKGVFRYVRPDGTAKYFHADSVHQANEFAVKANAKRDSFEPSRPNPEKLTILGSYIEDYIEYRVRVTPALKLARSWQNRCYALRKFAREFSAPPNKLKRDHINTWWDTLSYNDQKLRHAEFRKFFNYMMGRKLFKQFDYNPFTTSDDKPRLYHSGKPPRSRLRLDINAFWSIYEAAGKLNFEGLQIAMGVSLLTFMREGDILDLQIQHIEGEHLKRVISKSAAQHGHINAARLQWDLEQYKLLRRLITRGKRLSLKNQRCPYLVSYMPTKRYKSRIKTHIAQFTKERFAEQFRKARDLTSLWNDLPAGKKAPTFHEIRSLADAIAGEKGFQLEHIQHAMAHGDSDMTLVYQAEHNLPFEQVQVVFTKDMIGGDFK